jgi:hypothetical protein
MNILKEDQKRHAQELKKSFRRLHESLNEFFDLIMYFYGEDSEEYKNYHEKAQSVFEISRDISNNIDEKCGQ